MNKEDLRDLRLELLRRKKIKIWQQYPMVWLRERLGEDPLDFQWSEREGYESHEWDGDIDPLYRAWQSMAEGDWVGVEAATGTSKTYWLSRVVYWFLDCFEDSLVVTSAPKQDQLKLHLWAEIGKSFHKFKRIRPYSELFKLRLVVDSRKAVAGDAGEEEADTSDSWQAVGFVAGTGADEKSATRAQGFHRRDMLIIMEECPGMPESVMTAFQNTSTGGHNLILAVGNPDSELDPLHEFCVLQHVKDYRISALDYPNIVHDQELMAGAVTNKSISRRKIQYGEDGSLYQSRVRGICPSEGTHSLIKLSWIKQCIDLPEEEIKGNKISYNAVGVDVAASDSGDLGATAWGRARTLTLLKDFKCPNATHLGYNLMYDSSQLFIKGCDNDYELPTVFDYDISPDFVGVDSVGVGVATLECMRDNGYSCQSLMGGEWKEAIPMDENEKPMWAFQSLRAQMYWEAREDLRKMEVSIMAQSPDTMKQFMKEMIAPKVELKSGKIAVESKENLKKRMGGKSPNLADAFVYWNWVRKGYRVSGGYGLALSSGQ